MRPTVTKKSHARRERRDLVEAALALCCLGAVIAFSLLVETSPRDPTKETVSLQVPPEDEIYTGSILFVPHAGNDCRQSLLDNRTGEIRENGSVPCDVALTQADTAHARMWSAARVDAIRDGFSKR